MRNLDSPKYLVESFPLRTDLTGSKGTTATGSNQTWVSDRWGRGIAYFTAGGLTWSSLSFTSYEYMYNGTHYIFDGTNTYTNGVLTGSKPVTIFATGFSGVTATMGRIKLYNVVIQPDEAAQLYKASLVQISNSFDIEQPYPTGPDLTDPALVGAWLNPETTGAKDASANGNDGTPSGCRFERDHSAEFDGVDDYIEIADSEALRLVNGGTICAWIKADTVGEFNSGRIVDKSESTSATNGFALYASSVAGIRFKINNENHTGANLSDLQFNQWVRIVVVFNNLGRTIWINGVDRTAAGGSETSLPPNVAGAVRIGNLTGATDRTFDGSIRDVRIYSDVKDQAWVTADFAAAVPDSTVVLSVDGRGKDLSRYRNVTTAYGGAKIGGRRLEFHQDGYLDCGQGAALNPGTQDFWWSFWVKFNDAVAAELESIIFTGCNWGADGKVPGIWILRSNATNKLQVYISDGISTRISGASTDSVISSGIYKVDTIFDRDGYASTYINGVLQTAKLNISSYQGAITNATSTRLGANSAVLYRLNGWMDRVKCRIGPIPADVAAIIKREYEAERGDY